MYILYIIRIERSDPMIYILTGVAKSGKSTITKTFHKMTGIPYFSTDYIMMMAHYGNDDPSLDIDASDSTVSRKIEPYIRGLLKTMITNNETYIVEGVHFNTDFSRELLDTYPNDIRILYLGYRNTTVNEKMDELEQYKSIIPNQWYAKFNQTELKELVIYLIEESNRIYNECIEYHLEYVEVVELGKQVEEIIELLLGNDENI